MVRLTFLFALGAIFSVSNTGIAGDSGQNKTGATAPRSSTMTLGGKGTPASAAAADTELSWYHGYYRGYRRGFYNGFYGGWGPYYAGYSPYVYPYPYPYYYGVGYYPPVLGVGVRVGPVGIGVGIKGANSDVSAPAVALNLAGPTNQPVPPANSPPGSYRYDGGPANPIPLPKQDPNSSNGEATPSLPANTGLPVSLPKKDAPKPVKPYTYKGYGEK